MPASSRLALIAALLLGIGAPLSATAACPDAAGDCVVEGETVNLGGRHSFGEVRVGAGGRIVVPRYNGTDKINTGNLELVAQRILVAEGGSIVADGRGYQPLVCQDGRGPHPDSGGRGGCSVRDSGGGGAHFGGGGRGTKDCFIVPPEQSCQFPAEWEEDCGYKRANRNRCRSNNGCYNNDALPSVAGVAYRHSIYEIEMGAAGGDKGCRDGWDGVSTGGAGGGRIVLAGLAEGSSGEVAVLGRVSADGWRGCGHGNDSAGGGAGGTVLVVGDRVRIGPAARVSAEGGIGGDTQNLPYKDQACPNRAQSGGLCDDCGGGGGGGVISVLSGQPSEIDPAAELDVSGAIGGSCTICNGEAGGGAGELQLAGVYLGEICDGWDNDFDGETDEDLGTVSCGWGACRKTVPACDASTGRPVPCVPDEHPDCTEAAGDNRPRLLVVVDTSASMLLDVDGLPTFGDGSVEHAHIGGPSRLFLAKDALTAVLSAFPEIDYALARFAQHAGLGRSCLRASWTECGGGCCSYDLPGPVGDLGVACTVEASGGASVEIPAGGSPDPSACINYAGWCGPAERGADVLVGFGRPLREHLSWLDHEERAFTPDVTPGAHCRPTEGGDCELRATGPTPLAGSIAAARAYIDERRVSDPIASCRSYGLVLLTDGADTCLGDPEAEAAAMLAEHGVETLVVGFSVVSTERDSLDAIARAGSVGGARGAFFANTATDLAQLLAGVVAESIVFERCNGADDDCDCPGDTNGDGLACGPGDEGVDEGFAGLLEPCDDGEKGRCRGTGTVRCSADGGGVECDITDPGEEPRPESCANGADDDCDGVTDEGCVQVTELCNGLDDDGNPTTPDGAEDPQVGLRCGSDLGECEAGVTVCEGGRVSCDQRLAPRPEACNARDDDCDGVTDGLAEPCYSHGAGCRENGEGCLGVCRGGVRICPALLPGGEAVEGAGEWGPCAGEVGPGSDDPCDGLDNDCDGDTDEDSPASPCYPPGSGAGCFTQGESWFCRGTCAPGLRRCFGGGPGPCDGYTPPAPESCDARDNDCDGETDEELTRPCFDGCAAGRQTCSAGAWSACEGSEPAPETCDGLDNDCDGDVDEDEDGAPLLRPCSSACGEGTERCMLGRFTGCDAPPPLPEACDAQDNDCDGLTDEELVRACLNVCGPGEQRCTDGSWEACSVPAKEEVCDGVDNDCDGTVDLLAEPCKSSCGVGQRTCVAGVWGPCSVGEPAPERCNGRDDDCDGETDEADGEEDDLCEGEAQVCFRAGCVTPCAVGSECSGPDETCVDGLCLPGPCTHLECDEGEVCRGGECVDVQCLEHECPGGTVCSRGICVEEDCYLLGCPEGEACSGGECVAHPCAEAGCEPDQACADGECVPSCAGTSCQAGQRCFRGVCIVDPCETMSCAPGEICRDGRCQQDPCATLTCPRGRVCRNGLCRPDPCLLVICPEGQVCDSGSCYSPDQLEAPPTHPEWPPRDAGGEEGGTEDATAPDVAAPALSARNAGLPTESVACTCGMGPIAPGVPWAATTLTFLMLYGAFMRRRTHLRRGQPT